MKTVNRTYVNSLESCVREFADCTLKLARRRLTLDSEERIGRRIYLLEDDALQHPDDPITTVSIRTVDEPLVMLTLSNAPQLEVTPPAPRKCRRDPDYWLTLIQLIRSVLVELGAAEMPQIPSLPVLEEVETLPQEWCVLVTRL